MLVRDYIMPYFVYKIAASNSNEQNLDLQKSFDTYREARSLARSMRAELDAGASIIIKIIFADNEQEAEERLTETREAPILREWEK
jgi:exonuclease VII small subunit